MVDPPALRWLTMLFGQSNKWVEVRWSPKGQQMRREYTRPSEHRLSVLAEHFLRWARVGDVYVGVAPRDQDLREKRGGGLVNVSEASALWVDCDSAEAVELLAEFKPEPTMVVGSGTGSNCHAYWALTRPVPAVWIREGNARLAQALRADPKCAEPARILRPPGTKNWKRKDSPTDVRMLWETVDENDEPKRHPFSFVAALPPVAEPEPVQPPSRDRPSLDRDDVDAQLAAIPAPAYVSFLTGREADSRGYVQCPFHSGGKERTASLMAYAEPSRGWHCFGCGASGDIYAFGARLWNLSTRSDFKEIKRRLVDGMGGLWV